MEPSLTALRSFLAVAEELHFGRAAERLHTTTPTLSQNIKRLEQQLRFPLLVRSSRRVALTPRGSELVAFARHVIAASDELSAYVTRMRSGRPALRIGFWTQTASGPTSEIITAALREMPDLELQLRHVRWPDLPAFVLDGELDVAFCREPIDLDGLRATVITSEPRVLLVRQDHPLARRASISIDETSEESFILPGGISETVRRWWLVDPRPDGTRPRTGATATDLDEVLELVAAGLGLAVVSNTIATAGSNLVGVPIRDVEPSRVLLIAREHAQDPVVHRFEQLAVATALASPPSVSSMAGIDD